MKNRREFIGSAAVGLAGLGLPFSIKADEPENPAITKIVDSIYKWYQETDKDDQTTFISVGRDLSYSEIHKKYILNRDAFYSGSVVDRSSVLLARENCLKIKEYQLICSKLSDKLEKDGVDGCFQIFFSAYPEELINNGYKCRSKTLSRYSFVGDRQDILFNYRQHEYFPCEIYINNPNMI